jgi:hypothetical protein
MISACGGGGGGNNPTPPPQPTPGVTFTPTAASGANRMVMAHENPGNATTFVLQVNADQMTGLYGAGFDLTYPTAQLSYVSAEEGPFLNADGSPTSLQVTETAPGTLVVGVTRLGNISGASGSATVVRFVFAVQSAGTGSLLFTNTSAFGPNGSARGDIGWFGGSVRVIR